MLAEAAPVASALRLRGLQVFLLPDVGDHGDHFAAGVILLEPRNNDGSIQPARIGEHNFFWHLVVPLSSAT